jgi:mRNA-degrading endonuclease RelE of RelBE toxin-antitoxin system
MQNYAKRRFLRRNKKMVDITFSEMFEKKFRKFTQDTKQRIRKQINKLLENPEVGKPMRHNRKGTREVYVGHFRLSYAYILEEDRIILLDFYHKDEQ